MRKREVALVAASVVITGVGMVTPLGQRPAEILDRIERGESAARTPPFDTTAFACPMCAPVSDFRPESFFPDNKTLRLMNRDAQFAVVGARLAMQDAGVVADDTYPGEAIALYGATGLAGMPVDDLSRLIRLSAAADGRLDLDRFGRVALKRVRPVLSFKILANMPICFVSIFENVRGPNAVYSPWQGQGAQAIAAAVRAVRRGEVPCALVGGCDVRTRVLSFVSMQQLGVFDSWREHDRGCVPGEGAAFLVLEDEQRARARGAKIYARVADFRTYSAARNVMFTDTLASVLGRINMAGNLTIVAAANGDVTLTAAEQRALDRVLPDPASTGVTGTKRSDAPVAQQPGASLCSATSHPTSMIWPKQHLGDLFAASAAVQVALAAEIVRRGTAHEIALAHCFGFGTEQAAFLLEPV